MITYFEQRIRHFHGRQVYDKQVYDQQFYGRLDSWVASVLSPIQYS
jgi:hypothetical protein